MFDIEYKGANALVINTKKASLVIDPKLSIVGLNDVAVKNAIELATEERFAVRSGDAMLIIDRPGEYEISDFAIRGVAAQRHLDAGQPDKLSTMYRIEVGDVRIALLGNISEDVSEEQLEGVGVVDMVILPVGGNGYTLDGVAAAKLVRRIDARAVIPVHYADKSLKYEVPQDELEPFISALSGANIEETTKLRVKSASSLPAALTMFKITRS